MPLEDLIKEARENVRPASHGQRPEDHEWIPIDCGRSCPRGGDGSQAVYECSICGELDYGNPPGPGFHDCFDTVDGCGCFSIQEKWDITDALGDKPWNPLEQYENYRLGRFLHE